VTNPTGDALAHLVADPLASCAECSMPGWDGFDAEPISADTIAAARRALRLIPKAYGEAWIAPATDGTIGFEFGSFEAGWINWVDIGPGHRAVVNRAKRQ
jgi:hypothetical protein